MGDLLIRNVPQRTLESLKARARSHERSLQAEVMNILEQAAIPAGDRMIAWLQTVEKPGLKSEPGIDAIREDRDTR